MSRLMTAAATHTGYLRTTNQDLALASNDLAAVADGMGGHLGGEVAARIAVEQLLAAYRGNRSTEGLLAAVRGANEAVYQRGRSDRNLRGMGTTLTAVAIVADEPNGQLRLALVNVGDSRGYLLDRSSRQVHKLTEDHSVVEEMVRSGELTSDEAAVHPHKHILTRALGVEPDVEPDCWELDLEPGSRLLLCSDGLTNELDEQEIAQVLLDTPDVEAAASELVRSALQRGGTDNVTVVVIEVVAGDSSSVSGDVVVLPEAVGGSGDPAVAGESATTTGAVPIAPGVSSSSGTSPASSAGSARSLRAGPTGPATASTAVAGGAPKAAHTRPMLLVPQKKRHESRGDRIVTIRVALFVLIFVAVLGGAAGLVVWFDKASFYVGLDRGYVAIFQGRPGGLLWLEPSVVERTTLTPADLLASNVANLRQGMEESSYQAARNLVRDLSLERTVVTPDVVTTTTTPGAVTTTSAPSGAPFSVTTTTAPFATTTAPTTGTTTSATGTTTSATTTTRPLAPTTTTGAKK